jgi:Leucine-rich repeat (LRR) protein
MWHFSDFNEWDDNGRPINGNVDILFISDEHIEILGNLENLINLEELYCWNNQLVSLEGIENLIKLIKNNKQIKNNK